MSLGNHPYRFVCDSDAFFRENGKIAALLENAVIEQVYAAWDRIGGTWFDEAPMLVKTSAGMLSVHVKSETDIAIGWNVFSLSEKPVWFDETDAGAIEGLGWTEDLEWKEYRAVSGICDERIREIRFHADGNGGDIGAGNAAGVRNDAGIGNGAGIGNDAGIKDYINIEGGVGIGLACYSGKCLWIYDAGDVIAARVTEP